jgi:thioredoxin-related protein
MKKLMIIGCLFFTITLGAQSVKWYTLKEAVALNRKEPRKIMIDVYTDWCGWCKRMDRETFNNPVISEYMNKNFYPVKFNAESLDSVEFAGQKYGNPGNGPRSTHQFAAAIFQSQKMNPGYPAIAYINEDLQLIGVMPGFLTSNQIEPVLSFIKEDKFKIESLEEYQKSFVSKIKQ